MSDVMQREAEWFDAVPLSVRGHAIFGVILLIVSFGGFGWWSFSAPLAAAVISPGSFVATGENKIVQHLEGGIIEAIFVSEGDMVEAGDVLMSLDHTAALAVERELRFRLARLEAIEARLIAQSEGRSTLTWSESLAAAARDDPEVAVILDGQELAFNAARSELDNELRILQRDIEALTIRSAGYLSQLTSNRTQQEILSDEYETTNSLLSRGLARRAEVASVRRSMVEAEGQIGRLQAEIDEIAEVRARYSAQMSNAIDTNRRAALQELQVTQTEIDAIRERASAARDVASRVEILSPVTGTIVRLYYHTAGGVVESGKAIAEILPADVPLIVEALIARMRGVPGACLVLADFSPKNILVHARGLTLVDFETAHAGDPAFDLGFFLSHLLLKAVRAAPDHEPYLALTQSFRDAYLGRYDAARRPPDLGRAARALGTRNALIDQQISR